MHAEWEFWELRSTHPKVAVVEKYRFTALELKKLPRKASTFGQYWLTLESSQGSAWVVLEWQIIRKCQDSKLDWEVKKKTGNPQQILPLYCCHETYIMNELWIHHVTRTWIHFRVACQINVNIMDKSFNE